MVRCCKCISVGVTRMGIDVPMLTTSKVQYETHKYRTNPVYMRIDVRRLWRVFSKEVISKCTLRNNVCICLIQFIEGIDYPGCIMN